MNPGIILSCPPGPNPTGDTLLDTFPYESSSGIQSLVQFSGGGLPTQLSISGVAAQRDVLERKPDGSPRTFRAIAPIRWPATAPGSPGSPGTTFVATEGLAGTSDLSGLYNPTGSNASQLSFTLNNARGSYVASIATAEHTEFMVGVGNVKGNSGPDYLRMTRYYCPFRRDLDAGTLHEYCGAMIVFITRRVDLDGFMVEALFINSALGIQHETYSGNTNKNPGFIVYSSIVLNKGLPSPYTVLHADTFVGGQGSVGTGPVNGHLVSPFTGTARHLSSPGTSPGWLFIVYNGSNTGLERARSMMEGAGCSLGFEGRGFSARSAYGWGVNETRHSDPRDWPVTVNTFAGQQNAATSLLDNLKTRIQSGTSGGGDTGMNGARAGVWHCMGPLNPNQQGGELIAGHGLQYATGHMIPWLRLASMMSSRRVNHAFYAWGTGRPLVPADCLTTEYDPSPDVLAPIQVSLLHHDDVDGGISNRLPSTQFACQSPRVGGPDPNYGSRSGQQALNGPSTRTWNSLQSGEQLGTDFEDPSGVEGYSHNIAHSARFHHCRDGWLFGLSGIGYEISMTYGAYAASHHNAWETGFLGDVTNWSFGRSHRNFHAWGFRDLLGMVPGSGNTIARRRRAYGPALDRSLQSLTVGTPNQNEGRQSVGWVTTRIQAWSLWWQLQAAALGNDSYRDLTIGQPPQHNPADLVADWMTHISTELGVASHADYFSPPAEPNQQFGHSDVPGRRGALPLPLSNGIPNNTEAQVWTVTLDFHEVYWSLALDAAYRHVNIARQAGLQRALVRTHWMHVLGARVCDTIGQNKIGVPKWVPITTGTAGIGDARDDTAPNPPVTIAQLNAGELHWTWRVGYLGIPQTGSVPGFTGSSIERYPQDDLGWDHDNDNWLIGFLLVFRYGTPVQKQQSLTYLARRYNMSASSTVAQILQVIRQTSNSGSVFSRRSFLDGELELLV